MTGSTRTCLDECMSNTETTPMGFEPYTDITRRNRYAGTCDCGTYVHAGEGYYEGQVYCTQPGSFNDVIWICEVDAQREAKEIEQRRQRDAERVIHNHVPTEADLARYAKLAEEDAAWLAQGLKRCDRCGGAGGASHWPGWACYKCGGFGATQMEVK